MKGIFALEHQLTHPNVVRTHDSFYLDIDPLLPPKDSFIQAGNLIGQWLDDNSKIASIADMGCATGAFVSYLGERFPEQNICGYEYLETLVKAGQRSYPGIKIAQASIFDRERLEASSIDIITVLGVISIFDDIEPIVKNLSCWIKPGGKILLHGMFNPFDFDVFVKYRKSEAHGVGPFEAGWNVISQKTISKLFIEAGAKQIQFHEFKISVDLDHDPHDPLRSWTEKLEDGSRLITNATCLKQPQFILECDF